MHIEGGGHVCVRSCYLSVISMMSITFLLSYVHYSRIHSFMREVLFVVGLLNPIGRAKQRIGSTPALLSLRVSMPSHAG